MLPSNDAPQPAHILLPGRRDLGDLFRISGLFNGSEQKHNPFLVFDVRENEVVVRIVRYSTALLNFPPETQVMAQWPGKWRSDWFNFSVRDYLAWSTREPAVPASVPPTVPATPDDFGRVGGSDGGGE
jgi:hypothetical protein